MAFSEEEIKASLHELGLQGEKLESGLYKIIQLQTLLAPSLNEMTKKSLPRSLAIVKNPQAVQVVDELTDLIVNEQGLLQRAMRGEDVHDTVAIAKAKVESLLVGETVQPQTVSHIKTTTQRMSQMSRKNLKQ